MAGIYRQLAAMQPATSAAKGYRRVFLPALRSLIPATRTIRRDYALALPSRGRSLTPSAAHQLLGPLRSALADLHRADRRIARYDAAHHLPHCGIIT